MSRTAVPSASSCWTLRLDVAHRRLVRTTAVTTGAGSGMGRGCMGAVGRRFDVVVAVDLRTPDIDGTVGVACDISDPAAVSELVAQVRDIGPFRALVHAAG